MRSCSVQIAIDHLFVEKLERIAARARKRRDEATSVFFVAGWSRCARLYAKLSDRKALAIAEASW